MKTISITIEESLLQQLDLVAKAAHRTRSDLFRVALTEWLAAARRRQLAAEDRAGYVAQPVHSDEFCGLIAAQAVGVEDVGDGSGW